MGAEPDAGIPTWGKTALMHAAYQISCFRTSTKYFVVPSSADHFVQAARLLLQHGANPDRVCNGGGSARSLAPVVMRDLQQQHPRAYQCLNDGGKDGGFDRISYRKVSYIASKLRDMNQKEDDDI